MEKAQSTTGKVGSIPFWEKEGAAGQAAAAPGAAPGVPNMAQPPAPSFATSPGEAGSETGLFITA